MQPIDEVKVDFPLAFTHLSLYGDQVFRLSVEYAALPIRDVCVTIP